uniref:Copper homeostasis protein cutC homolog n=1 Tax=Panagrolaimus sp. ES5 TaxID=591445 RepID=A0AC34FY57_9BILA
MIVKEFCAENFTHIPAAIEAGANRIELCDNLAVGGTTVSLGVLKETVEYCNPLNIPVMAMIRPRGGNFIYNESEIRIMLNDIAEAKKVNVDGVVFGALSSTVDGWLDENALKQLIEASNGLQITFHMAFDLILPELQFKALEWLAENGVGRILTHGGPANESIETHFYQLKSLIQFAKNSKIIILPGGKITAENCENVMATLGVAEVHGTKIVNFD